MKVATNPAIRRDIASVTVSMLERLGVESAFGVIGGGIAPFADALEGSIPLIHCRHESGAAFAAAEFSLARRKPAVVFVTTGPGLLNALNGMVAARWEGAHVILISAVTSPALRGRWAFQETTRETMPSGVFGAGGCFHYSVVPEDADEFPTIQARLWTGLQRPNGFVANIGLSRMIQRSTRMPHPDPKTVARLHVATSRPNLHELAGTLANSRFVIWVGHGARNASDRVRLLATRSGAPVMSSPRGKGVFPERSPQYLGVTGFGGDNVTAALRLYDPEYALVLGTRLGEFTSFWNPALLPSKALIHVDTDDAVFGAAYPTATTQGIQCEIGTFLDELLEAWPKTPAKMPQFVQESPSLPMGENRVSSTQRVARPVSKKVRTSALMEAVQRIIIDESDAIVMTEAGNAFAWGSAALRFDSPRYRVSTGWGSMGQASAGIIGAALGSGKRAVAILGDGAMLLQSELSTAVQYGISTVWIVLNDGGYGMIEQAMKLEGLRPRGTTFPSVDFVSYARSMGASAERVTDESDLDATLQMAMSSTGPFLVDVIIDPAEASPIGERISSLEESDGGR